MAGNIEVQIKGVDELIYKLQRVAPAAAAEILAQGGRLLLGYMKKEPKQRYVTRKAAYGKTFFTDKQRRWFFWALANGNISVPYSRTHELQNAWQVRKINQWQANVINTMPGAKWVIGKEQSRHEAMVGWRKFTDVIAEHRAEIKATIVKATKDALRMLRLNVH